VHFTVLGASRAEKLNLRTRYFRINKRILKNVSVNVIVLTQ
jgi:hypothetical protein